MKKTLIISVLLAGLLNLWSYARASQQRAQASIVTPAWQASSVPATPRPARAGQTVPAATAPAVAPVAAPATVADPATATAGRLAQSGLRSDDAALYLRVQAATGTPWQLLAAVHKVETGQRGNTSITSYAGAQGPMQFMPTTFRAYAMDGDGNGAKTITDLDDAMMTAGRYLAAGGADKGRYSQALYNYNHSSAYVSKVLGIARKLGL